MLGRSWTLGEEAMLRAIVFLGALLMTLLAGCGEGNVFELAEGDCFNDEESVEISDVEVVSCDDPHQNEVYAVVLIEEPPELAYPGSDRVSDLAADLCLERFDEFVGLPYVDSRLDIFTLAPTQDSWESLDDREVICSLYDLDSTYMEGSMRGSGR